MMHGEKEENSTGKGGFVKLGLQSADKKRRMYWLAFALWAGVIFYFSAQPDTDSVKQSGFFAHLLEQAVCLVCGEGSRSQALYDMLHTLVRKGAHFTVYLILGVISERAYHHSGAQGRGLRFALSLLTCALYAATDEIHQYFVPGRAMMLTDVLIDSAGACCGVTAAMIAATYKKAKKIRKK